MNPGSEADKVYVVHMLECIHRIAEYTRGGRSAFIDSSMAQDAVVRNLQTLTESSQRLSKTVKASVPSVPWRALSGFRNVVVHSYLGIDLEIVWRVIEEDLPPLRAALLQINASLQKDAS